MTDEINSPIHREIIKCFAGDKKWENFFILAVRRTAFSEENGYKEEEENQKSLATIGDSVLDLLVAERLFLSGKKTKGEITIERTKIVKDVGLYEVAKNINLQKIIVWGSDEKRREIWNGHPKVLATCLEAIFGGLFLAKGYDSTKKLFEIIFSK
ncbi:MAG: ribonuclease III domain-containing protein [Candidatus Heimdallarchaeota archaeon]